MIFIRCFYRILRPHPPMDVPANDIILRYDYIISSLDINNGL